MKFREVKEYGDLDHSACAPTRIGLRFYAPGKPRTIEDATLVLDHVLEDLKNGERQDLGSLHLTMVFKNLRSLLELENQKAETIIEMVMCLAGRLKEKDPV